MSQLDFSHILRLHFVNAKTDHQIWNNVHFFLGLANDFDGLIDVQQDLLQTLQQVQFLFFLIQIVIYSAFYTHSTECDPFFQQGTYTQDSRCTCNQDIEVTGETVLQRSEAIKFLHQFIRIHATFQIDSKSQTGQIGFVTHIGNFFQLTGFDQLYHFINDGFCCSCWRNLGDFQTVVLFVVTIAGTNLK